MIVVGAVLVALPIIIGQTFGNSWVRALNFALLYAMLALGLNIVVGYAGLLDLGYIAFYAVGAYMYSLLNSPHFGLHLPIYILLPLGALVACVFGVLLGAPTLKLRGDYLAIVTLGFGEIIRLFMNNLDRPINITNGPQGINNVGSIEIGGLNLHKPLDLGFITLESTYLYYYLFVALAILIIIISIRLQDSRIGRAWVAIREDEIAATAMGINTRNVKLTAFAMGASFGGVAGGLFAGFQGFVSPESFTLMESIMVLAMVVLGGMGHIPGVILGALMLSVTPELLRDVANMMHSQDGRPLVDPENLRMLLFGLAMVVIMLFRPAGLWPSSRRRAELRPATEKIKQQEDSNLQDAEKKHE
ncbi:ABC transporter ATP-binding protein [Chitinivorax sp. B]|uniref:branched-chain amino acid ABC transporter permease n=1 Tax=Chitinivorax sp. B TaxID=2502235 RepID=UPI002016E23C|nr:ABC transporter ATP-binding protein [Chitinivorax sp. B]